MRISVLFIPLLFFSINLSAQNGWDWGPDKEECKQNYVLLQTSAKAKRFGEAHPALTYLLKEAPNLNKALYQYGAQVFEGLASAEKDPTRKAELQDSALIMYDTRIKHFGEEKTVLNYKGRVAYAYLINNAKRRDELYPMYKKIYELNGVNTKSYNMYYYFDIAGREKRKGNLTEEQLLALYEELGEKLEKQANAQTSASSKASILSYKDKIDAKLSSYVKVDCDFINKVYAPKFEANPDLKSAKTLYNLLLSAECLSEPIFLKASEYVMESEPSYAGYRIQAKVYERNKDFDNAVINFEKAVSLAKSDEDKAKTYMDIAEAYKAQGKSSKAREYAYKYLELAPDNADGYVFIGNLYMYSSSCTNTSDRLQGSLIYIAAYDKYQKAGNSSKMSEARKYFPTMEQIFSRGKKEGDVMNTGCWIGENVSLRKR